ncbi:MAG: M20 metallopeptidase family protein [Bacillota bacterium]
MNLTEEMKKEIMRIEDEMIEWRRDIHQHPELGFEEERTSALVTEKLKNWGYEVEKMAGTGVVANLKNNFFGKTIAIRADMDALPLEEKTEVDYKSQNTGKMHACGHDAHTAIALGTAKVLSLFKNKLKGNVKFIFQPAEEGPGGAKPMIEEGVLESPEVDRIIGLHNRTTIPVGQIGVGYGAIMASTDKFIIKVKGTGAHGAHPDEGVDPVVVASHLIIALQELVSRETEPTSPLVITTGSIHGGTAFNIIPDQVKLKGTVRTLNTELRNNISKRIEEIVKGITTTFRADYELDYQSGYPVTVNDKKVTKMMEEVISEMLGAENIYHMEKPSMGGEDFAYYLQEVPGSFVYLGSENPEKGIIHPGHSPKFNIDEDILVIGVELFSRAVLKYLNN